MCLLANPMSEFLTSFWPNFASTVIGVILAIPPGLWLARSGERARRREERQRVAQALGIIRDTLEFNRGRFRGASDNISQGQVPFELTADFSAWDAVKSEIIPFMHAPEIQRRLAYHFSRTAAVSRLHRLYFSYIAGTHSALIGSLQVRDMLENYLLQVLSELEQEANGLIQAIQALQH